MAFTFWPSLLAVVVLTFSLGAAFWRWDLGPVLHAGWRRLSELIDITLKPASGVWMPPEPEFSEAAYEPERSRVRAFVARRIEREPFGMSAGRGLRLAT